MTLPPALEVFANKSLVHRKVIEDRLNTAREAGRKEGHNNPETINAIQDSRDDAAQIIDINTPGFNSSGMKKHVMDAIQSGISPSDFKAQFVDGFWNQAYKARSMAAVSQNLGSFKPESNTPKDTAVKSGSDFWDKAYDKKKEGK